MNNEPIDLLRAAVNAEGTITAFAPKHGISGSYVSTCLQGKETIGPKIRVAIGLPANGGRAPARNKATDAERARTCAQCSASFMVEKRCVVQKFCSHRCDWLARGGAEYNARVAREGAEKNGNTQRGRGDARGYRKRRGRHEHRVVAEVMLGRHLLPGEIVHHVDENKQNNEPGNLRVMTQAEHMREHGLGIPGVVPKGRPWEKRWRK